MGRRLSGSPTPGRFKPVGLVKQWIGQRFGKGGACSSLVQTILVRHLVQSSIIDNYTYYNIMNTFFLAVINNSSCNLMILCYIFVLLI